jgi:hypothetical protein
MKKEKKSKTYTIEKKKKKNHRISNPPRGNQPQSIKIAPRKPKKMGKKKR